jgi:cell division protein FtsX
MLKYACVAVATVVVLTACTSGSSREVDRVTRPDAEIVIAEGASREQIAAVRHKISTSPVVKRFAFVSRRAAFREFKRIFAHTHSITKRVVVTELPKSFRVEFVNDADRRAFQRAFLRRAGVSGVTLGARALLDDRHLDLPGRFTACRGYIEDLEAFLKSGAGAAERRAFEKALSSEPGVRAFHLVTTDEANRLFQCAYRYNAPADALPASYAIFLNPGADEERIVPRLESQPGVDEIRIGSAGDAAVAA